MKFAVWSSLIMTSAVAAAGQTFLNLEEQFNVDLFLESGGTGLTDPLDDDGRYLDAGTLPEGYADGGTVVTADGRAQFRFAPLQSSALDAAAIDGQTIEVPEGSYSSLDLGLLAAPGSFAYPFGQIELNYADGTSDEVRLGPVAGWFASPTAFDNAQLRYADESGVESVLSFQTGVGDDEFFYLVEQLGNGLTGNARFVDAAGFALYGFYDLTGFEDAQLGITVGNNFRIAVASAWHDPHNNKEGYTVIADSMEIHDGFEHRALGNLKEYVFDISDFIAEGTGEFYILFTDATPQDGWGPYIQRIRFFTGETQLFDERITPEVEGTILASFQTATSAEEPYLFNNSGHGPSNRGHRFADGTGTITYRFDLPDDQTEAFLTVDMANNFVVSIAGPPEGVTYAAVVPGTPGEGTFLVEHTGTALQGNARFADAAGYMIYEFDLPDDVTTAFARVHIANQFVVEIAGADGEYQLEMDWVAENGGFGIQDQTNLDYYVFDLAPYLENNPENVVRLRFTDGIPQDGWGPFLRGVEILNDPDSGSPEYQEVLNAFEMFGEDIRTEYNKGYYTIDLSPVLTEENSTKEVYVRFADGSTADGWGPGIFWMAVHEGDIQIHSDQRIFEDLRTTLGDPVQHGAGLLHRRYPVNPAKTLSSITFPPHPGVTSTVYLLAATLNEAGGAGEAALSVSAAAEGQITISWPSAAAGYRLQFTSSLSNPDWQDVAATPVEAGGTVSVEVPAEGEEGYFRLVN